MKKVNGFSLGVLIASTLICFGALIFSGCQNDLLESPSFQNRGSYSTGKVSAPTNVTATQGGFRSITLKWTAAKSAVLYNIYSSDTATGTFDFLEQTPDATCSYTLSESPDVKKYYKIKSVDSNGEVSDQYSQICFGTTLATPIITSIKQNANGDAITVRWYKGVNCTPETYLNSGLIYTVVLYNADGTQVIKEETISAMDVKEAADTKYTFKNLTPNTEYCIQIKAYTKASQDSKSTENSDILNQSTAHSLIPAAPENFAVSKGTSKDQVTLSWTLPKFAEIKSSTAFETRPVYFKIYRKLESAPENAYEPIVSYLGTTEIKANEQPLKTEIHFIRNEESEEEPVKKYYGDSFYVKQGDETIYNIEVGIEYPAELPEIDPNYPNYIPGTKITLSDKTVTRGQKYSYRVQSFIDDNGKKNVTSDESLCEDSGWLINSPTVSVSSTHKEKPKKTENEPTKIESFTVTLNFKFDDFGQPYNYVITEICQNMEKAEVDGEDDKELSKEERYISNSSYSSMFPKIFEYIPEDDDKHYKKYSYKVSICDSSSEDISDAYYTAEAPGCVIVINDESKIPNVDDFKITDGYKDKFILSWTYKKDCKYTLKWKNIDKDNNESPDLLIEILDNEFLETKLNEESGIVTFEHSANSGDTRKQYTLTANNGLEATNTLPEEYKTLGTPEPYFEPSYKSIKVIWKPVQKASKYEITTEYKKEPITAENISEIQTDENGNLYCEITEPYGKNDDGTFRTTNAEISGQKIDFKITAISQNSENTEIDRTTSSDDFKIFTLGPGAIEHTESDNGNPKNEKGLSVEGAVNSITLRWNNVEGAKGYLIIRKKYSEDYYPDLKNKADIYYYSEEDKSLELIQDESTVSASCYKNGNEFTFKDNYQPAKNYNNQYEIDQAQLKWGLPYGYTVIPVIKNTDFIIGDGLKIQGTEITYTESSLEKIEKQDSTYGYGLALKASKATSKSQVALSWATPYKTSQKPTIYYRSFNEANGSVWKKGDTSNSLTTAQIKPESDYKAYDYVVCYSPDSPDTLNVDSYFEDYIATKKDSNNEKDNKGYILALEAPTAKYGGISSGDDYVKDNHYYYSENLSWKQYNPEEKRQGFDSVEIFMLNTNKKDGWVKIVDLNPSDFSVSNTEIASAKYDLLIEKTTNSDIAIMPKSIIEGGTNTNGLLKVLRDAKHYYMIKGARTITDSEDKKKTIEISIGDNGSIYAYRQITDEELVKSTMLVIADLIKDSQMEDYGTGTAFGDAKPVYGYSGNDETGKFTWEQDASSRFNWKITKFTQGWNKLPYEQFSNVSKLTENTKKLINFITISDADSLSGDFKRGRKNAKTLEYLSIRKLESEILGIKLYKDFDLNEKIPLVVTASQKSFDYLSSYSGTVKFATSDSKFSVILEHNGSQTFKKDVSGDEVKKWFPAKIGKNAYTGDSTEYWWE